MNQVKFNNLNAQWLEIEEQAVPEIRELFYTSQFILGPQVKRFEEAFAEYCRSQHGIGVSNGTDAIKVAAKALELKGRPLVFMPANTFVATWLAIKEAYPDAVIELVDVDQNGQMNTDQLERYLSRPRIARSCLVVAVHMYGCCDTVDKIRHLASKYECLLLEDASQAHGAKSPRGTVAGSVGDVSAFSLYPGKNLGAAGDAGIIVTNNEKIAERCRLLRNYGSVEKYVHESVGHNHRLDSIQAIILYWKLRKLDEWNRSRSIAANKIRSQINNDRISWMLTDNTLQVYHILPVLLKDSENRNVFMKHLDYNNVECGIHYPVPIHKMPFYRRVETQLDRTEEYAERMVSLPIHPFLKDKEILHIIDAINTFGG